MRTIKTACEATDADLETFKRSSELNLEDDSMPIQCIWTGVSMLQVLKRVESLLTERQQLTDEVDKLTTTSCCELGAVNQLVADYMAHWEARASKAEAKLATLRAEVDRLKSVRDSMEDNDE